MSRLTLPDVFTLAQSCQAGSQAGRSDPASRLISIWEITTWILPMAPEHLRRVLASAPDLPQGFAGVEGGTRWFTAAEVAQLRAHFAKGARKARYQPQRGPDIFAPLITLAQPMGKAGRSTAVLHLATAAALAGHRVLLIDADPAGHLAQALHLEAVAGAGVLSLIARSAGQHLLRLNEARLDRGEVPLPMEPAVSAALRLQARDLIRPTAWPGLDLLPAPAALMQADLQINRWRMAQRSWQPWQTLAQALAADGLRARYDLILCDPGPGLGPLALSMLACADLLLVPLPLRKGALDGLGTGLQALAEAMSDLQDEAQTAAQALGQTARALPWRKLAVLPTRAGSDAAQHLTGFAAKLGAAMLPAALPEVAQIARGSVAQFYDLDYRDAGKLAYSPQRDAIEAVWHGLADVIRGLQQTPAVQAESGV